MADHNAGKGPAGAKPTFWASLNEFSDLTEAEFSAKVLMRDVKLETPAKTVGLRQMGRRMAQTATAPLAVDWRTSGQVTPVKNQGQCGSCW